MPGIIVGIDGSVHAHRALQWAIREAALRRQPLTVITVPQQQAPAGCWGDPDEHPEEPDPCEHAASKAQEEADGMLGGLADPARPPSVSVRAVAGVPGDEILTAAKGADMIVVGSRGAGGFSKLLMGSVSSQVTHHAQCPVVVIPADERASQPCYPQPRLSGRAIPSQRSPASPRRPAAAWPVSLSCGPFR
jgi:nucleotide-binding universal stress UspA family protein